MSRFWVPLWFASLAMILLAADELPASTPASATKLPLSTHAYVSIAQPAQVRTVWRSTALGGLFEHPAMREFSRQFETVREAHRTELRRLYGVDLDELVASAAVELAVAIVETPERDLTVVFLADTGQPATAVQMLQRAAGRLQSAGGRPSQRLLGETMLHSFQTSQQRQTDEDVALFARDGVFVVGGDTPTVAAMADAWDRPSAPHLAERPALVRILEQVDRPADDWQPSIVVFADPVQLANLREVPRTLDDGTTRPPFAVRHGFDCIRGIGGRVAVIHNGYALFYRMAIDLQGPLQRGMHLLQIRPGDDFQPPAWLPDYVNSVTMLHWQLDQVIEHVGPLFDDIAANDVEGTFDEIVADARAELDVDLPELFAALGPRVVVTSDLLPEVSTTSQRDLVAIEIKPGREAMVAEALSGMFADDPTAEAIRLTVPMREGARIVTRNHVLWRVGDSGQRPGGGERQFTAAGMMAVHGHLLIATNYEMLRRLFQPASQLTEPRLAEANDLQRVVSALPVEQRCGIVFARTDRDFFTTYQLLRAGRLEKAETVYGRVIAAMVDRIEAQRDDSNPSPRIDFSRLPEFSAIESCFGNAGICVQESDHGWAITGFLQQR